MLSSCSRSSSHEQVDSTIARARPAKAKQMIPNLRPRTIHEKKEILFPKCPEFTTLNWRAIHILKAAAIDWLSEELRASLPTRVTPHQNHKLNGNDEI